MTNRWEHIDDLIGKVLAGEATVQEQDLVQQWIQEDAENQKYVDHLKKIFTKAAAAPVQVQFDTDAAWKRVKERIHPSETKTIVHPATRRFFTPLRIAAGLIALVAAVVFAYQLSPPQIQSVAFKTETLTVQDTLPDGSTAFLNKKTELKFEYDPKEKTRKVKLAGEAYFAVKHQEEKPFVIEADEVLVRDIGTEFNLKAYPGKDTIEIIVTHGEVQFYTRINPGLNLKEGDRAIYSKRTKEFYRIERPDTNALAYKTKIFSFNSTELRDVVALLNEVYNSKIKLANEAIYACRLTANFKEDNAEIIAEVIAETMGLTLTKKDKELILDGKGCDQSP